MREKHYYLAENKRLKARANRLLDTDPKFRDARDDQRVSIRDLLRLNIWTRPFDGESVCVCMGQAD
jgi:hypothetical protein